MEKINQYKEKKLSKFKADILEIRYEHGEKLGNKNDDNDGKLQDKIINSKE